MFINRWKRLCPCLARAFRSVSSFATRSPSSRRARSSCAISSNVWHHVTMVSDGSTLRVYLNGALLGTPQAVSLGSVTGALQIVAWIQVTGNHDFFGGTIDDVGVYNS